MPYRALFAAIACATALFAGVADRRRRTEPAAAHAFIGVARAAQPRRIYPVPSAIAADCSRDATAALHAWFASVPDSSTLVFGRRACYRIEAGLVVTDRYGLVFDGNGATFRVFSVSNDPNRANWTIRGGGDITLRNMIARGANPHAGINEFYDGRVEWQHAYRIQATQTALLDSVQAYDPYGDFVEAEPDATRAHPWPGAPARDIVVRNSRFERSGRMGLGLTHVDGFTLENSYVGDVKLSAVDMEPNAPAEIVRRVRILGNTFGRARHAILTARGQGATGRVGATTFSRNVMAAASVTCVPPVSVGAPRDGQFYGDWTFEGNRLWTHGNGFELRRVTDVVIRGNTIRSDPSGDCKRNVAVSAQDSHRGIITANVVEKSPWPWFYAYDILSADSLTTGFSESRNVTRPSPRHAGDATRRTRGRAPPATRRSSSHDEGNPPLAAGTGECNELGVCFGIQGSPPTMAGSASMFFPSSPVRLIVTAAPPALAERDVGDIAARGSRLTHRRSHSGARP